MIKQKFFPPVFPVDETKTELSKIINSYMMAGLVFLAVGLIGTIVFQASKTFITFFIVTLTGMLITVNVLFRHGYFRLGSFLYILVFWGLVTTAIYFGSVTSSPELGFYIILTVIAGIMLGARWALALAVLNSSVVLGIALLEVNNFSFPYAFTKTPLVRWFDFSVILFFAIVPVYLALTKLSQTLSDAEQDNKQRNEAEQMLQESREHFRNLVEGSIQGILVHRDTKPLFVNSAYVQILGFDSPEEVLALPSVVSLIAPYERQRLLDYQHARMNAQNAPTHYEYDAVRKDGSIITLQQIVTTIQWDGKTAIMGTIIDVTERKRAELALQESQERYHSVVETMAEGIVMHQANGEILFANAAAEHILGLSVDQLMGRTSFDPRWRAIHEDGTPFPGETHPAMRTLRTGRPLRDVVMGVHKPDGNLSWISINSQPLLHSGQSEAHGVVATFHDITRQKEAERALKESEQRLNGIVASAMDAIIMIDKAQRIVLFNPTAERIFGYAFDEINGQPLSMLMPQRFHQRHEAHVNNFGQTGVTNRQMGIDFLYGLRKNGQEFPIEASISQANINGEPYYTAILRDITQRIELQDQFYQAQKMEAVGHLAGGIAHDFNNLLTPIMMYADLGMLNLARENPLYEYLEKIENAASMAKQLTQQILALSRKQLLVVETVQLNDVVKDTSNLLGRLIGENITLKMRLQDDLPSINADVNQLSQIIMNLVINASDAMLNGGDLEIGTSFVSLDNPLSGLPEMVLPNSYVLLSISDTGIGMDEETMHRLFEPFYSTKESGRGTGLGLTTVYSIVQRHRGFIQFDSQLGSGTTFRIYLPISTSTKAKAAKPDLSSVDSTRAGTILIVEDETATRLSLTKALELLGYHILEATNGEEALQIAATYQETIHLLLTDIMMPGMNGFELGENIAEKFPSIKVLYMSGYSGDIVERLTLSTQVTFLQKPFTLQQLKEKITGILKGD